METVTSRSDVVTASVKESRAALYQTISPAEIIARLEVNQAQVRRDLRAQLLRIIAGKRLILSQRQTELTVERVLDDVLGFGPIEPLLGDEDVTEIMINGPGQVYIERGGRLELTDITFEDSDHLMNIIDKVVAPLGRRIDESSPMVDARLPDGSRVNAVIPPIALCGPTMTVRKFRVKNFTLAELVDEGTVPAEIHDYLKRAVSGRQNVLVTGGTGSGKTTLLNALSALIPSSERIVTIEDAAELRFGRPHVVGLEARPANIEGSGRITIRELVINALRMRPDRIVVGEVRGAEALDMLQAMNTGHDGSMTTAHANSPVDALSRIETMVLMAGLDLPVSAVRGQISGALDIIVHLDRSERGQRIISSVVEVGAFDGGIIRTVSKYEQRN